MTTQRCLQQQCMQLYKKMARQLDCYESVSNDEKMKIEWAFGIAINTWFRVQSAITSYQFADRQEEINFFKILKPKFIGLIDFFTLLYKSALFQPDDNAEKKLYWQHELEICKSFLLKHKDFRRYYKQRNTAMDHVYFIQQNNQTSLLFGIEHVSTTTSYSHLLARLISIKKYQHYLRQKISNLYLNGASN